MNRESAMLRPRDWWLLAALIVFQGVLYHTVFVRELAWHYPENFDQAGALFESYDLETNILAKGWGNLWAELTSGRHMNGLLLPIEGALSGLVFGGARLARLAVNFAGLVVVQAAVFATVFRLWRRRDLAFLAVALLMCMRTPWHDTGGLLDFRIDFMAFSLFGLWVALALRSDTFLGRRGAIACGIVAAVLILHRFIAVVTVAGVSAGFALLCLGMAWARRGDGAVVSRLLGRVGNLLLSGAVAATVAGPFLTLNFSGIYAYYGIGHILGEERLFRAREQGLTTVMDHLLFYPRSILFSHFGLPFLAVCIVVLSAFLGLRDRQRPADPGEGRLLGLLFCLGAVAGPVIALTCDISKSPVVGGIVGVPAVLTVVVLAAWLGPPRPGWLAMVPVALALSVGGVQTVAQATRQHASWGQRDELGRIADLDLWMMQVARAYGWAKPRLSMDRLHPAFTDAAVSDTGFERTGRLMQFRMEVGNGVGRLDWPEMLNRLSASDFVILTTRPPFAAYPFDLSINEHRDRLNAWVAANMLPIRHEAFAEFDADIYIRPSVRISGASGGWILDGGIDLECDRAVLLRFPVLRLFTPPAPGELAADVAWSAAAETVSGGRVPIAVEFERKETGARLTMDLASLAASGPGTVRIHLGADRSFVPRELGLSDDGRHLVLQEPKLTRLFRSRQEADRP
jgi:hypothetical protein